jgi:hypothetical protein
MKAEQINSEEDMLNYIEGCLNDLQFGISDRRETISSIIELIEFVTKLKKKNRSTKANALYWLWMKCLEDETGQPKEDYHDYFKDKFIGVSIKEVNGRKIIKEPSTKKMLSPEFNNYMKKVQSEAAIEFSVVVPLPEDQGFDEFYEKYKYY